MRAGDLRHPIVIQQRTNAQDGYGQVLPSWQDMIDPWASVQPISGAQLERARSTYSKATHKVTIRWQPGLGDTAAWSARRILFDGRVFDIGYTINVDERNHTLILLCSEGTNEGG